MLRPNVDPGMKQTDKFTGTGIQARNIGTFVAIAVRASKSEIAGGGFSSVLLGHDVVNLKRQRQSKFWHAAVFAMPTSSLSNRSRQFLIHCRARLGSVVRRRRALDCITPSRTPMWR